MLDLDSAKHSAKEHYEELSQRARDLTHSTPEGENAGISRTESGIAMLAAVGAGLITRQLLKQSWRAVAKQPPPANPTSHEVAWREALLWGAVSGAVAGMARIASRRASTAGYRRLTR